MIRKLHIPIFYLLLTALSGCAVLDPGPPMAQVILPVRLQVAEISDRIPIQLIVSLPVADGATGSDRIMALMNGFEVRALDTAKWVSPAPLMVQRLLIDSLEATRRIEAVGLEESGMDAKVRLAADLRRFFLRYDSPDAPPTAEIVLIFSLSDLTTGKAFARKMIKVDQPCTANTLQEFVAAFSVGMSRVLSQSNEWVVAHLEAYLASETKSK